MQSDFSFTIFPSGETPANLLSCGNNLVYIICECATVISMSRLEELRRRHAAAEAGGGAERRERQHKEGKLSARQRVELLLDEGTFEELDKLVTHRSTDFNMDSQKIPGDGVVSGYGRIEGRTVFVFAQDFTVFGGSLAEANAAKICKVMDRAMQVGAPI